MLRLVRSAVLAAVLGLCAALPAAAVDLTSIQVIEEPRLPKIKPNWPVPNDRHQIFYLQRSTNRNTVVYAVRFDEAGNINSRAPAAAYWRRFADQGEAKQLKPVERRFAYGVNTRPREAPGEFVVTLKPLPQLPMLLRQIGPFQAELLANIGGRTVQAVYVYITVEGSGIGQRVTQIDLFGRDPRTGGYVGETFRVQGGLIGQ